MTMTAERDRAVRPTRPSGTDRILAAPAGGAGPGWRDHLAVHGPLSVPGRHEHRWSEGLLGELSRAGLTGRGGAGFPTARKAELFARGRRRPVLVVNAMEGEPASLKDRVLVTRSPHLVLDGAVALAAAVGADEIVVCVAADRPDMVGALDRALGERNLAVAASLLATSGHYAAGEESALVDLVAGGPGLPSFRPDKGVPLAIGRRPMLLHNAETLAHVALIARHGADWFRTAGTPDAPGTTLVTVSGMVRPGVLEVSLGISVRAVLERAGISDAPEAVLLGGYGGAWIGAGDLDAAFEPVALRSVGAAVGAGVVAALPAGGCGVAETARVAAYLAGQSAGQCGPCTFGLPAIADDLARLAHGRVTGADFRRLQARLDSVEGRGACRLPDGAVRLVRSAMAVFGDDVARHRRGHACPGARRAAVLPIPHVPIGRPSR